MILTSRTRIVIGVSFVLTALAVMISPAFSGATEAGETRDIDIAPGTYTLLVPGQDQEVRVTYLSQGEWLREVVSEEPLERRWLASVGGVVYNAHFVSEEISVTRDTPVVAAEGFILDPVFLEHLRQGTLPEGIEVEAQGQVSESDTGVIVPERMVFHEEEYVVTGYTETIDVTPQSSLTHLLDQGFSLFELGDAGNGVAESPFVG